MINFLYYCNWIFLSHSKREKESEKEWVSGEECAREREKRERLKEKE